MIELLTQKKVILGSIAGAILIVVLTILYINYQSEIKIINPVEQKDNFSQPVVDKKDDAIPKEEKKVEPKELYVHISGRVKNPGLIRINEGSRVNDAVLKAGGLMNDADMDKINLAAFISDGEKIYIPKIGEYNTNSNISTLHNNNNPVNINYASIAELDSIPNIGLSTAEKIIQYRAQKGYFKKIEDIMNIQGIGTKKFNQIKSYITI